jgi:hypothetical protein
MLETEKVIKLIMHLLGCDEETAKQYINDYYDKE